MVKQLSKFKEDLWKFVGRIEFRRVDNDFQSKMQQDIQNIKQCDKIIVPADKSENLYKMDKSEYDKHLENSITTAYKKTNQSRYIFSLLSFVCDLMLFFLYFRSDDCYIYNYVA